MKDPETFREVCQVGVTTAGIAVVIFGLGSRASVPGFRVAPASSREWIAYWFHTLEFLVCCCALLTWGYAFYYLPAPAAQIVSILAVALPPLLILSVIVFWRRERRLSVIGLAWAILAIASLLFPAAPVTKLA